MSLDAALDFAALESRFEASNDRIQAFLPEEGRFERLARQARELTRRFPEPGARPPLFGSLLGVKDIFHVDGLPTRAGSRIPPERLVGEQAEVVSRLGTAGALVLGKTVTTEFAYFAPGPTRNPHDPAFTPGGSSSGSAAAVAAGICAIALGTQTIGSISRPAAFCGITGFKPSYDRFSRSGVIPLSPSLDHVGLFATDLVSLETAARVLADDWSPVRPTGHPSEAAKPVLGIPEGPYLERASPEGLRHFRFSVDVLRAAGFRVLSINAFDDIEAIERRHQLILAAEASAVHESWYPELESLYDRRTRALIEEGIAISKADLEGALPGRKRLRAEIASLAEMHSVDLWISPAATGPAPEGLESTGSPAMNLPWTHAGVPTLALPSSKDDRGLPLGIQLAAGWWQDEKLLDWGAGIHRALAGETYSEDRAG